MMTNKQHSKALIARCKLSNAESQVCGAMVATLGKEIHVATLGFFSMVPLSGR